MSESTDPDEDHVLLRARFDPRLPRYYLIVSSWTILLSFIGIPLLPFWLLGLGRYVHRRQYESLESELTERTLNIRKGFLFRTQQNLPLDKLTDLAVNEGPVLRRLGLCSLRVETAGGGAGGQMGQAHLPGVIDAVAFRDAVLRQRDIVCGLVPSRRRPVEGSAAAASPAADAATLREIRDSLGRIEKLLDERLAERS